MQHHGAILANCGVPFSQDISRQTIPSELKDEIASFCSDGGLFVLSIVDREFHAYAERRLYRDLFLDLEDREGIAALDSVAANPSKLASYVRMLGVDFHMFPEDVDIAVMGDLVSVLPQMSNLETITIRSNWSHPSIITDTLTETLCVRPFAHLRHLFIGDCFGLQRIVDVQRQLRVLGVFYALCRDQIISIIPRLKGRPLWVLGLTLGHIYNGFYAQIDMHPTLLDLDHPRNLCGVFQECERAMNFPNGTRFKCSGGEGVAIFLETTPRVAVLEQLLLSLQSIVMLQYVCLYVKPGLLKGWKWRPTKEVAQTYYIYSWNGDVEEYGNNEVVFEGPENDFIKFISTF